MKTNNFTKVLTLVALGTLSVFNAQAQTALSGNAAASNGCATTANTGGVASNTSVGCGSGKATMTAANTTLVGKDAGGSTTSGSGNTGVGHEVLFTNTTGTLNSALGDSALYANTSGTANTAIGNYSLIKNTTSSDNTAVGAKTLMAATITGGNSAVGFAALTKATSVFNSAVGYEALINTTTGTSEVGYNTAIGATAGLTNTTGDHNTFVGAGADANAGNLSNATALGSGAIVPASNEVFIGNTSVTVITGNVNYTFSDARFKTNVKENVKGLAFINKLRPVTYNMDTKKADDFLIQNMSESAKTAHQKGMDFAPSTSVVHSGFLAQEVAKAAQDAGFASSIVHTPSNSTDPYAVSYSEIVVPLVKAVQEQQVMIESQQKQIDELKKLISASGNSNTNSTTGINTQNIQISNVIVLNQNAPNPFAEQTSITYNVPQNTNTAQILFYDSNGKLIKTVDIKTTGKGQINVYANDLTSGTYSYTLVIDGKVVDTKKMMKE